MWSGLSGAEYMAGLREYRPCDMESAREMLDGRYLLASKLVDTHGVSPFSAKIDHLPWHEELNGFSWLRHFEEARNSQQREFARTLVLDWIGRNGDYNKDTWGLALSSRRLMNWLRHFSLLSEGASQAQINTISQSIALQVQAAKIRAPYASERFDELMATMLLVAVALCDGSDNTKIENLVSNLCKKLIWQLHEGGFYRSRNSADQLALLEELVSIRLTLSQKSAELISDLGPILDNMHLALDAMILGTGEPAYFNGCGQLPTEMIFSIQSQGKQRLTSNANIAGYGIISQGSGKLIMDNGLVPIAPYATKAHASALAIEFSHGNDLIVGSCGPAPEELRPSKDLFRQNKAHSGPGIDNYSSAKIASDGKLHAYAGQTSMEVGEVEAEILANTKAYRSRFGVEIERRVTLLGDGETLVGQDRLIGSGNMKNSPGALVQRFHLAPGAFVERSDMEELVLLRLKSGAVWTFLWEGARLRIEESVRQSAHIGYHKTQQIVLETEFGPDVEVSWIFTRQ
ncbi:hypothetical protein MNBD_ALPHA11-319 [hydrothermal vent metagenome]|uniref:Heparinase II/III-like C-terminal domain-containing protein n=1 Tax=hydrothermal vent metagenome TaxID=652676 RepID=A0A3B0UIH4_9ZZZZ